MEEKKSVTIDVDTTHLKIMTIQFNKEPTISMTELSQMIEKHLCDLTGEDLHVSYIPDDAFGEDSNMITISYE